MSTLKSAEGVVFGFSLFNAAQLNISSITRKLLENTQMNVALLSNKDLQEREGNKNINLINVKLLSNWSKLGTTLQ